MPREEAERLLSEAYHELDAGKMLRTALKLQREAGWDPPHDVQYVVEPRVEVFENGLGVSVQSDIMLYDQFPGVDQCVDIFEDVVAEALLVAVAKRTKKWLKRHPG